MLFLDTRPLHALLMQNVAVLEQKIRGQPLSDKTARRSEQLALVSKLASQVDPEFKPFARRGERTSAAGAVDAIVGFAQDLGLPARGGTASRARARSRARASAARWSSPSSGARATRANRQVEQAQRRLDAYRRPGRSVGSEGREPDRIPPAGADERRQRGHARHARRDPPARRATSGCSASSAGCAGSPPTARKSACR